MLGNYMSVVSAWNLACIGAQIARKSMCLPINHLKSKLKEKEYLLEPMMLM